MSGDKSLVTGVAGRYATALFELAQEQSALEPVSEALNAFSALLDESADLERLVRSPVFSADDQKKALLSVIDKAGISGITANFLGLVAQNRRLFVIRDIIKGFFLLLAQHRGEVAAEVSSATPLSDEQMTELKAALKSSIGKDVQVETKVDPSLLGGLVVKVGSRMIDSSLRTRLNNIKVAMKEVG